ncbi:unnamed protein product [Symbiodinium natans]|uniref:Ion transport domain-containing protein n=1 Tax=Symbiodinium natans TaxID=878477 RepID=A0A812S3R4_9DINO|nr:unnamed protein product [Symbiodinium natans]
MVWLTMSRAVKPRLQNAIVAVTALCCFTSCLETLAFFDDCEATAAAAEDFDTGLGFTLQAADCSTYRQLLSAVSLLCLLAFLVEFLARCWCHPRPWKMFLHPTGVADVLVISGSLPITLACLGGFAVSHWQRNFAITLRLWRLAALERFVPAFGDFLEVLAGRGYQLLQVCYVLTSFWFILAAYNWYFLHSEFQVTSEDKSFACWYSNFWFAMQFTLIHMSGDYPMTEYPVKVRLVHACSLFSAWAFVTMPAAMLTSAFHDALEKRRLLASQKRNQALCKIVRLLRRIILRRRFRGVADRALAQHSKQLTSVGLARQKYPRLAWLLMFLHSDGTYLFVLGTATLFHIGVASLRTIPELEPQAIAWDVAMFPLILFFVLNFAGRGSTAFMNPTYRCSTLFFVTSYQRLLQLLAFGLYFHHLAAPNDERRLKRACAAQISFIVNFGQILGTSSLLNLVWAEIRESLIVMSFVSGTFWVLSATLWYLAEGPDQGMTDMFSTLYYTCIFLLGEWCSFDFSPVGAGLSMLYSIVGVGLNAMPMAAVQDALTNMTDSGAYHLMVERRRLIHSTSNLRSSEEADARLANYRPRRTEVEMQVIDSLDQPIF